MRPVGARVLVAAMACIVMVGPLAFTGPIAHAAPLSWPIQPPNSGYLSVSTGGRYVAYMRHLPDLSSNLVRVDVATGSEAILPGFMVGLGNNFVGPTGDLMVAPWDRLSLW